MNFLDFFNNNEIKICDFKKNSFIQHEGEYCSSIGYIIDGSISIFSSGFDDDNYLITTLNSNDTFGESLIFSDNPTYLGSIISTSNTKIAFIFKETIINKFSNPDFVLFYSNYLSNKTMAIQQRCKILSQKSIKSKILFYLYNQIKVSKCNVVPITSKERLSEFLNIPRPSLSRVLIQLKKEGIITFDKHSITLII